MLKEEVSEVRKELDELQEEFGSFMEALEDQDQNIPATPVDVDREKGDKEDLRQRQEGQLLTSRLSSSNRKVDVHPL